MKRLFKKNVKSEEVLDPENPKESTISEDMEESRTDPSDPKDKRKKSHRHSTNKDGDEITHPSGEGDAGTSSRGHRAKADISNDEVNSASSHRGHRDKDRHRRTEDEGQDLPPKPKPKPRQPATISEPSPVVEMSDSQNEDDGIKDYKDFQEENSEHELQRYSPSPPPVKKKEKEKTSKHSKRHQQPSSQAEFNDSAEDIMQFVNKEDLPPLPKIEPGRGMQFMASSYNYRKPISSFKIRARLLKYPSITEQGTWPGDLAVIDDRVFHWQEKVFSKAEAKRFHKRDNCLTEQEKKYYEELRSNPGSLGKSLYSYVSDDPYVLRKALKILTSRCPVSHLRKGKTGLRLSNGKAVTSDGESIDLDPGDNLSLELDEPLSSSTPKAKRKEIDKKKEALEVAKAEKKNRERNDKELKDLERRNLKLKELKAKEEGEESKRLEQEEAKAIEKAKKLEAVESEEKERRQAYMKKYKYSRRPSLPVGARIRIIQLTPSPRSKKKGRNNEKDEEKSGSENGSLKFRLEKAKGMRRIGYEQSESDYRRLQGGATSVNRRRKASDRFSYKNIQTMYIMASVPYLPGKYKEVVVCMIRNIPRQGVIMCKPAIGYRNVELKRNHIYRLSCELHDSKSERQEEGLIKEADLGPESFAIPRKAESLGITFELAPKNEMRLTVMGEITTAEGFDEEPLNIYYLVDIPKGWRNDSIESQCEGMTHASFTNRLGVSHFSHEFSFHLVFSMDVLEKSETYPTPVIAFMAVSMDTSSRRIIYEGYGYLSIPKSPGTHYVKVRMWKPSPRTTVEKLRSTFLGITASLQDIKFVHMPYADHENGKKANLLGFQTEPTGTVKIRLNVIHQMPIAFKEQGEKLDLLEKMSSTTMLRSVQAVIDAFQRAREKAIKLKGNS